jgi:hypothetical protein
MRRIAIPAMMFSVAFLAACSGTGATSANAGPAPAGHATAAVTTSPTPPALSPIEGTWRSGRLTEPEFIRFYKAAGGTVLRPDGSTASSIMSAGEAFFRQLGGGARQYAVITLRFQSGQVAEFESGDGRPASLGYSATYQITGDVVRFSDSGGGCVDTYRFRVHGGHLRLHLVSASGCGYGSLDPPGRTLFASFPFTKVA